MTYHYQNHDKIVLGSGELYLGVVANPESATEEDIVAALKNVGAISAGASLTYTPETTNINSANRGTIKTFISGEEVVFSSGVITWKLENLEMLSGAKTTINETTGEKRIKIGGRGSAPILYLRFIHKKDDGGELIVNIQRAQSNSGFSFEFSKENPVEIGYEFTALANQDKSLVEIVETFPEEEGE